MNEKTALDPASIPKDQISPRVGIAENTLRE